MQAGDHIDNAVADDQAVDSGSLLPQDADAGPQVDDKGDQCDRQICKKVTPRFCLIHLDRGIQSHRLETQRCIKSQISRIYISV